MFLNGLAVNAIRVPSKRYCNLISRAALLSFEVVGAQTVFFGDL
ncbi:hypothetical protein ABIA03_007823 [Bradyrhizobium yuanmingense]|uniref:Uncharacterized protein n=1 Tax=Bradyrhizobium yuanmingense TaxID=108015 RepID=A0ABV4GQV7_9BRAD